MVGIELIELQNSCPPASSITVFCTCFLQHEQDPNKSRQIFQETGHKDQITSSSIIPPQLWSSYPVTPLLGWQGGFQYSVETVHWIQIQFMLESIPCTFICSSCHIHNILIGVKYRNLTVYLLFAILLGQFKKRKKTKLQTCNLKTDLSISYKYVNQL